MKMIGFILLCVLIGLLFVSFVSGATIFKFFDGFETGVEWDNFTQARSCATGWKNDGSVTPCATGEAVTCPGDWCACNEACPGGTTLTSTTDVIIDLTDCNDASLSWESWIDNDLDIWADAVIVRARNGSDSWTDIFTCLSGGGCDNDTWSTITYNFTTGIGLVSNLSIQFFTNSSGGDEEVILDNVTIFCEESTPGDTSEPTYSNNDTNTTTLVNGTYTYIYVTWDDETELNYTWLGNNFTGSWINETPTARGGLSTINHTNITFITAGYNKKICWQSFANDTSSNFNDTEIYCYTTQDDIDYPTYLYNDTNTTTYTNGSNVLMYIDWSDNYELSYTWLQNNFTGSWINETPTSRSGLVNINHSNITTITSGYDSTICWQSLANDTANNINTSNVYCYTTEPEISTEDLSCAGCQQGDAINLTLDGSPVQQGDAINLTLGFTPQVEAAAPSTDNCTINADITFTDFTVDCAGKTFISNNSAEARFVNSVLICNDIYVDTVTGSTIYFEDSEAITNR